VEKINYYIFFMKNNNYSSEIIKKRSQDSKFLNIRSSINEQRGKYDLDEFITDQLGNIQPKEVLDLGCGRGKQIKIFRKKFPKAKITGIDISHESIDFLKSEYRNDKKMEFQETSIEHFFMSNSKKYDLIIASYALYYVKNISKVLKNVLSSLTDNGIFCVVGPYGDNNQELFSLIGYENIDPFVIYTSRDFMIEIINFIWKNFKNLKLSTLANPISYKSVDEVMAYWSGSTFFKQSIKDKIKRKLNINFKSNGQFIITKQIMLSLGANKK